MREISQNRGRRKPRQPLAAGLLLLLCSLVLSCQDRRVGFEESVIEALNRSILAIEDAGDASNAAFANNWPEKQQLDFSLSLQIAQDGLQRLTQTDADGSAGNCMLKREGVSDLTGCRFIGEARSQLDEMRQWGTEIFQQLSFGNLKAAARAMALSDAAAANARRSLYRAQEYYVQNMQTELVHSSDQVLRLAFFIIFCLMLFIILGIHFILQSRHQQQLLMERDRQNQDYTRKLEKISREVRRLRDLGSAIDATAGVLIFNEQHTVISVNEGFRQMRGLGNADVQGRSIITVMGLDDAELVESIIAAIADKKIWRGEIAGRREDGSVIWMYVLFHPELDDLEDFEGSLALVLDITESKKAQVTLDRTHHLTALGEMAGGIAHEINNPLSVITGRVTILLKKVIAQNADPQFLQTGLEQIQRTVSRIARIVDSMRRLARADVRHEEARPEKLETALRETLEFTEDKLKKYDVTLTVDDPQSLAETMVMMQGFGLSQILINLIGNAVDAIETVPYEERWIRLELGRSPQGLLQMRVIDPGRGIPKAIQEKIMDPFFTTKPAGKGTGLGLSLSQTIAAEHGGRLYLDSEAAHTTFVLEVPDFKRAQEVA